MRKLVILSLSSVALFIPIVSSAMTIHGDIHPERYCSGQLKLATALEFFQYRFSDSFGGNPPL